MLLFDTRIQYERRKDEDLSILVIDVKGTVDKRICRHFNPPIISLKDNFD